ncbi:MAG: response regulator [Chloroflexi bacterium]|jgi:signal transduction histidine kinase|nr:response regulator [Chloroflexota bacterium]
MERRLEAARVAIVDDEAANVRVLERFLRLGGFHHVRSWTDPVVALEDLEREPADVVLLDLAMPVLDGYAVLARLRGRDGDGLRTPVVVLTADVTRDARDRALGLGASDFLTKPFDPTEIELRIRNILATRFLELDLLDQKASLEVQVRERTAALRESLERLRVLSAQRERLVRQLVTAQEEERRRVAADIHDDTIQTMVALGLRVELARRKATDPELQAELDRSLETVRTATRGLRELLFRLHPAVLDRDGLQAALRAEVGRRDEEESTPVVELTGAIREEPGLETRTTLFRIAQEAIGNARRHSGATSIAVHLAETDGGIELRVTDDGRGMDPDLARHPRHGHLGLVAMRERAELAGGRFSVTSHPGAGTTIEAWLPTGSAAAADDLDPTVEPPLR